MSATLLLQKFVRLCSDILLYTELIGNCVRSCEYLQCAVSKLIRVRIVLVKFCSTLCKRVLCVLYFPPQSLHVYSAFSRGFG